MANHTDSNTPDPFDLASIRAPQDFHQTGGVKRTSLTITASTKPPKEKFFRVHPFQSTLGSEEWCINVVMFPYTFEGDMAPTTFIVTPNSGDVYQALSDKLKSYVIVCGITKGGSRFLWELALPDAGGNRRGNSWAESRLKIAQYATEHWCRPEADTSAGGYTLVEPLNGASWPEPDWGDADFATLTGTAYKDRMISSVDHEAVKEFLGG